MDHITLFDRFISLVNELIDIDNQIYALNGLELNTNPVSPDMKCCEKYDNILDRLVFCCSSFDLPNAFDFFSIQAQFEQIGMNKVFGFNPRYNYYYAVSENSEIIQIDYYPPHGFIKFCAQDIYAFIEALFIMGEWEKKRFYEQVNFTEPDLLNYSKRASEIAGGKKYLPFYQLVFEVDPELR